MMMGNKFRFYGNQDDVLRVWTFISGLPGMQFIEAYSEKNRTNRQFEAFPGAQFLNDEITIAAWPSVVGGQPRQKIERLSPQSAENLRASGRCVLESPAFISMTTDDAPTDQLIGPRKLIYYTEKAARRCGSNFDFDEVQIEEVDWAQLKAVTDKIISYIKRSSEVRWNSMPVLPGCASELRGGSKRLWDWGRVGTI